MTALRKSIKESLHIFLLLLNIYSIRKCVDLLTHVTSTSQLALPGANDYSAVNVGKARDVSTLRAVMVLCFCTLIIGGFSYSGCRLPSSLLLMMALSADSLNPALSQDYASQ